MVSGLREAVESEVVAPDSVELTEVLGLIDVLQAKAAVAIGEFDAGELWDLDGRTSMADWLRVQGRMARAEGFRLARMAQRLRDLPAIAAGWEDGSLSSSQVRVITAPLNQRRRPAFAEVEAAMAALFASLDVTDTEQVMAEWVDKFDDDNPGPDPGEPDDTLYHSRSLGDRGELRGSFSPTSAALIDAALAVAETKDADGELRVPSERRADALVDIVRHFLDTHDRPRRRRHAPHVNIVVTPDQLEHGRSGHTLGGRVIPGWGISTLACDSAIRRMVLVDGEILELGRLVRTATPAQFDAVATRDRHCRYPGCDRPASWCDAHHAFPWENGGLTDVDNLVLLCRRHHTRIHQRGVHAKLLPDATLEITLPGGRVLTSTPPKPGPLL